MTTLVLVLLAATALAPALTLLLRRRWVDPTVPVAGLIVLLLAVAALLAALADDVSGWRRGAAATLAVAAATTGGSDVVRAFFRAMRHEFDPRRDHPGPRRDPGGDPEAAPPRRSSESVLRGGVWIGYLERAAIAATLLAGWPEGVALVLAVKGVGRYPELRGSSGTETDASEAFIIGTLVSVLFAAAAAGTARLVG
jgi:hypothetical protein